MIKRFVVLFLLLGVVRVSNGFDGISIAGDFFANDPQPYSTNGSQGVTEYHGFELAYVGKAHRYFSVYGGYSYLRFERRPANDPLTQRTNIHGSVAGLNIHPDWHVLRPYVGLGMFVGNRGSCRFDRNEPEQCDPRSVYAVFPEAGLDVMIDGGFIVSAKLRRYEFDARDLPDETMGYVSLSFTIR